MPPRPIDFLRMTGRTLDVPYPHHQAGSFWPVAGKTVNGSRLYKAEPSLHCEALSFPPCDRYLGVDIHPAQIGPVGLIKHGIRAGLSVPLIAPYCVGRAIDAISPTWRQGNLAGFEDSQGQEGQPCLADFVVTFLRESLREQEPEIDIDEGGDGSADEHCNSFDAVKQRLNGSGKNQPGEYFSEAGLKLIERMVRARKTKFRYVASDRRKALKAAVDYFCEQMKVDKRDVQFAMHERWIKGRWQELMDEGLILVDGNDPVRIGVLPSSAFNPATWRINSKGQLVDVTYNAPRPMTEMEFSMLVSSNEKTQKQLAEVLAYLTAPGADLVALDALGQLGGAFRVGPESEFFVIERDGPHRGELAKFYGNEFLVGMDEPPDDMQNVSPLKIAVSLARQHSRTVKKHRGKLVLSIGTPPTGSPQHTEPNIYADRGKGSYVAMSAGYMIPGFGPKSEESWQVREQQAAHHQLHNAEFMVDHLSNGELHTSAARQFNGGLPHVLDLERGHEVDFEVARNTANLMASELGSLMAMLMASSPFLTGIAPKIDGRYSRDIREIIRNDTGSAMSQNEPIRDRDHFLRIVTDMIVGDLQADRLERAIVVNTVANGVYQPTFHGTMRWRIKKTGAMTGRLEYLPSSASSILPSVGATAIMQIFQLAGILSTHEKMDSLDFVGRLTGTSDQAIWGDSELAHRDFLFEGPGSFHMKVVAARMRRLIKALRERYSAAKPFELQFELALAAMKGLENEGDLFSFANGIGTQGGSLLGYARQGVDPMDVALMVHHFQAQEAYAIRRWNHYDKDKLRKYFLRKRGFNFELPDDVRDRVYPLAVNVSQSWG